MAAVVGIEPVTSAGDGGGSGTTTSATTAARRCRSRRARRALRRRPMPRSHGRCARKRVGHDGEARLGLGTEDRPRVPPKAMTDQFQNDLPSELTTGDFSGAEEPFRLFAQWLRDAEAKEPNDPNAMALASVDDTGLPDVRMVLLKGFDEKGFVFYTNFESKKGVELLASRKAALLFHWKTLRRQIRIRGAVEIVTDAEADAYFASARPRQPDRRLGVEAVAAAREPLRAGEGGGRIRPASRRRRGCRVRPTGRASVWCRRRSSSGTTAPSACTTASSSPALRPPRPGTRCGSTRDEGSWKRRSQPALPLEDREGRADRHQHQPERPWDSPRACPVRAWRGSSCRRSRRSVSAA